MSHDPQDAAPSAARKRAAILAAALPALLLSGQFFHVLFDPLAGGNRQWAADAIALMMVEFLLVHAGFLSIAVMSGAGLQRAAGAVVLAASYAVFVGLMAWLFRQPVLLLMAGALLAGRLWGAATRGEEELAERATVSVQSAILYLGLVMGSAVPEHFPAFGFTPDVIRELRPALGAQGGIWVEQPQRAVAGAALYFLAHGVFELARLLHVRPLPAGGGWTRLDTVDAHILADVVELRQSGTPGQAISASLMGGIPIILGTALLIAKPPGPGAKLLMLFAGPLLLLGGLGFAVHAMWNSMRRITLLAAAGRLEVCRSWPVGGPHVDAFGPEALEQLDCDWSITVNDRPASYTVVMHLPHSTLQLLYGIRTERQARELIELIASRVRGEATGARSANRR